MNVSAFIQKFSEHPLLQSIFEKINGNQQYHLKIGGLKGSFQSIIAGLIAKSNQCCNLFIFADRESALYFLHDLSQFIDISRIFYFPSSFKHPGQHTQIHSSFVLQRSETLNFFSQKPDNYTLVVTYAEAFAEKVLTNNELLHSVIDVHKNEKIDVVFLKEALEELGFRRVDFVYEPGQFSLRGSIIDVFSYAARFPYRIDFFGNEVESIRSFDVETQLSIEPYEKIRILPEIKLVKSSKTISLLEYLPENTRVWFTEKQHIENTIDKLNSTKWNVISEYDKAEEDHQPILIHINEFRNLIDKYNTIEIFPQQIVINDSVINFNVTSQPIFHKNFELLAQQLHENIQNLYTNIICSENEKQLERLQHIFSNLSSEILFDVANIGFHEGFIEHDLKIALFTDHQIFERYHRSRYDNEIKHKQQHILAELTDLHPGDYIVHVDHGIGIFGGIEKVEINGKWQEVIKLVYKDNDVLYVGVNSLHRLAKYRGKDGEPPKIYKLGTGAWQKLKQTTKKKIKDISKELISLYAKRIETRGFAFSPDTYLQEELEASFIYEDTPDQEKATRLVKQSMESSHPSDILICGDVGFGKTEVAIRAAFKAAVDNKQTAVLVPTTILALQHYKTFSERLKDFPVKVDYVSRMRKPSEIRETLRKLELGEIDIIIGTHKLLSNSIKFKDLGLVIIDEEQKFGVAMKEKLKVMKVNIDTITLTATPIPRTLQFSLMGARDLAIISTPPPNRFPVITELHVFNENIIRQGILNEISRGGQVFFVYNRIQGIHELEKKLKSIIPEARIIVTHGQMDGEELENRLVAFINGDFDVLLTTAIIESGIDIPNANTIFILDAHQFGLSDLHQLRGRVGRSNKKAFCYLLVPSLSSLTSQAKRRLKAIEEFSDLGSGFHIAMLDLDIRGAGNLLGAEQSGFIAEIGYETYLNILNEAIQELKEEEFRHLFFTDKTTESTQLSNKANTSQPFQYVLDCQVDTDFEIMLPENYIENIAERIRLYRELDSITNEDDLIKFEQKLIDRFGPIPKPAKQLMDVVRLRRCAIQLGIERVSIKNETMTLYFVSNQTSLYYHSEIFERILKYVQENPHLFVFRHGNKPSMQTKGIKNIQLAIDLLKKITETN